MFLCGWKLFPTWFKKQHVENQYLSLSVATEIEKLVCQVVLNYQMAVYCFAFLDTISTVFNLVGVYAAGLQVHVWQLVFLLLLLGPLCGLVGASRLKRSLVLIFVVSCGIKALIQVGYALYSGNLWTILFAFLQCAFLCFLFANRFFTGNKKWTRIELTTMFFLGTWGDVLHYMMETDDGTVT